MVESVGECEGNYGKKRIERGLASNKRRQTKTYLCLQEIPDKSFSLDFPRVQRRKKKQLSSSYFAYKLMKGNTGYKAFYPKHN